jgi:hypothetical protein
MNETKILQGSCLEVESQINKLKLNYSVRIQGMTSNAYDRKTGRDSSKIVIDVTVIVELYPLPNKT